MYQSRIEICKLAELGSPLVCACVHIRTSSGTLVLLSFPATAQSQERGPSGSSSDVSRARDALTAARHRRDARALPKDEEDYFNEVSWLTPPMQCCKLKTTLSYANPLP